MILLALGGNLTSRFGAPTATFVAALERLAAYEVVTIARSQLYETAPVPVSDQPWFINGVAQVTTQLEPEALLALMLAVETDFGRVRGAVNAARTLDLDLLAYNNLVRTSSAPLLPHPRLQDRAFVLHPLRDVAPSWTHPVLGLSVDTMIAALPPGQDIRLHAADFKL
jgi:2-amino-4-hydroxy-6-hydroxymethyldihydropteridine diphosphokinase